MIEVTNRIKISEDIFNNEYEYFYGKYKDKFVTFEYYNFVKDKSSEKENMFTYKQALELAYQRGKDGRYKNFEFWIY